MPKQFWGKFRLAGAAAGVTALLATLPVDAEAASPFRQLAGTWKGAGQIMLSSGARERLSCRGYYTSRGTGNTLSLAIRCASPSYRIEMRSSLAYNSGRVVGRWEERTFNAAGTVRGVASANRLNLAFGGSISGSMSVALRGSSHSVNISTPGAGFSGIAITLSR